MNNHIDHSFYSVEKLASATECTGLMPAMPPTMDGQEELTDMMAIHCPPGANGAGGEAHQWERAVSHPSDEHSRLTRKVGTRLSNAPVPNHPAQGRNQRGSSPSPAQGR